MQSIRILPYNTAWPAHFASLQEEISRSLGDVAERIAHIGSTAVHGLGAKDIIDIQVGARTLTQDVVARMSLAGFEYVAQHSSDHVPRGSTFSPEDWKKLYFRGGPQRRPCHVHVRALGSQNHRYALLFRDYLRTHEQTKLTVELIKQELARLHGDDADAYYAVKDPVYDLVWQAANEWAKQAGWNEAHSTDA